MAPEAARRGAWGLLTKNVVFRRLWADQTASVLGDRVSGLAMPLTAVLVLHASAPPMGLLTAASLLPFLVLAVPVGGWVDRRVTDVASCCGPTSVGPPLRWRSRWSFSRTTCRWGS